MSDNELDNLFKEAAEGFTPPQDESAWKQMAAMLDKNPVKPPGFWNWKTISTLTGIGFIAITAVWYTTTGDGAQATGINERNQEANAKTVDKNESNNATQRVGQKQKEQPYPAGQQNLASVRALENKSDRTRGVGDTGTATHPGLKSNNKPISSAQPAKESLASQTSSIVSSSAGENEFSGPPEPAVPDTESGVSALAGSAATSRPHNTVAADSIKPLIHELAAPDSLKVFQTDSSRTSEKDHASTPGGVLSVKAVVSPDFSSINYFSAGKTGINYGLLIGYSFNNRWTVYTGVISSKKLYDTEEVGGSYNWDGHTYPVKKLDGDCRILDIPINVYYTFFPERAFSLRAGLGFSSYIMRKESYVFCVDNYGYDAYYKQEIEGENNEWFKVMNISLAVSKKLTSRLSAEFEPFVKAPLTGVGEGKVSLVSMGAFINVKYDLVIFK